MPLRSFGSSLPARAALGLCIFIAGCGSNTDTGVDLGAFIDADTGQDVGVADLRTVGVADLSAVTAFDLLHLEGTSDLDSLSDLAGPSIDVATSRTLPSPMTNGQTPGW